MTGLPIAAIVYGKGDRIDEFMVATTRRLAAAGLTVGGLVQHNVKISPDIRAVMEVEDLMDGRRMTISEERGMHARGCLLDARGLAEAAVSITAAIRAGVDVVVVNKFGKQESLGEGFSAEIGEAVASGLTVLTAVRDDLLPEWTRFAGDEWTRLSLDESEVLGWCRARRRVAA